MTFDHRTPFLRPQAAVFLGTAVLSLACLAEPPAGYLLVPPPPPARMTVVPAPASLQATLPASPEPDGATAAGPNPFTGKAASPRATSTGQTLTAPVTVNANTTADALTVTQSGAGRAISGAVTSSSNGLSAVKGITAGTGSGVNGVNSGTSGQAGKFEIINAASTQPSLLVTTTGTGSAVQAIVKSTAKGNSPAVLGQHNGTSGYGIGVEGDGGSVGVKGNSDGIGVSGTSTGGYGVQGISSYAEGLYGVSSSGTGAAAYSTDGYGVYGSSQSSVGVYGRSVNSYAVYGYSGSSVGVYGRSDGSYAGFFSGPVYATGAMTAASYGYTSDRDQKQDFADVDSADVLSRIAAMPITAWDYKAKPAERHIGPMAQDFHAAFGLGADDRHIDVVDGIGVSLAAIKELQRQLVERDARIDRLESQLQARIVALEQSQATPSAGVAATAP